MVLLNWLKSRDRHRNEAPPRPYMQPAIGDIGWRSLQHQKMRRIQVLHEPLHHELCDDLIRVGVCVR